ncbi:MAG: DNA-binding protein [Muribaculaceae bacterium]|nr:DNA-binding protein [Muribaculaceae bacterium]MBQ2236065.1 DNA-binding protein [Muribaculaceae bacterium]MBQ4005538.1 DNA-binding protein [Muribaculaceae bacterium]
MPRTITFNELRRIKSQLPEGSIHEIADKLQLTPQSVRNYFGGSNYDFGTNMGVHIEPGPDGGYVILDDPQILDMALDILNRSRKPAGE